MSTQPPADVRPLACHAMRSLRGVDIDRLREASRASGRRLVEIDLSGCTDRTAALQVIGRAFDFPRWYGANLDALYDALTDLGDSDRAGFVVLLDRLPSVSRGFSDQQRSELLKTFRDTVNHYRASDQPFSVYFRA